MGADGPALPPALGFHTIRGMPASKRRDAFYAVWPTAWGAMGGVAGPNGAVRRLVLPHYLPDDLRELLAWEHPGAAEDARCFERLIERTRAYFDRERVGFDDIDCELPGPGTSSGVVARAARQIPYGETRSYGDLARRIGRPDAARAVATAMSKNRIPLIVPCHRVTYADGSPGGFSAPDGVELKQRMLRLESRA